MKLHFSNKALNPSKESDEIENIYPEMLRVNTSEETFYSAVRNEAMLKVVIKQLAKMEARSKWYIFWRSWKYYNNKMLDDAKINIDKQYNLMDKTI